MMRRKQAPSRASSATALEGLGSLLLAAALLLLAGCSQRPEPAAPTPTSDAPPGEETTPPPGSPPAEAGAAQSALPPASPDRMLTFFGRSAQGSMARFELPENYDGDQRFLWQSSGAPHGPIDTGFVDVPAPDWNVIEGGPPERLVFTATSGGLTFKGDVLFRPHDRAVIDVTSATASVRYLLIRLNDRVPPPPGDPPGTPDVADDPGEPCGNPSGVPVPGFTPTTGHCVREFSGEFSVSGVDLRIPGRGLDFIWARTYRSKSVVDTEQGNSWDYSYNIWIASFGADIILHDGNTRSDRYFLQPDGSWSRPGFFRKLVQNPDESYTLTFAGGGKWNFHGPGPNAGRIESSVDRNGNSLTFAYDGVGRLETITDTLDRAITVSYNAEGLISGITDFVGRTVTYDYYDGTTSEGSAGDLKSVTTPAVTMTPNGNDFPDGKITTYTYSKDFADDRLNHNLLSITDGRGNEFLTNTYATTTLPEDTDFDRVIRQIWGGGTVDYFYVPMAQKTIINDPVGNVREYFFDAENNASKIRSYTGRADPAQPTTESENRPGASLRSTDPPFFERTIEWNDDSLPIRTTQANGNITEYVYESEVNPAAEVRKRGDLRVLRRLPGTHTPAGDQSVIEESFEYAPGFGGFFEFVTRHVDARGNETIHTIDPVTGNRTHTQHRIPSIVEDFEYNNFGQLTKHTHPDNGSGSRREDVFTYYDDTGGHQEGYLKQAIIDEPNLALTATYEYDEVGNVVKETDPRGGVTDYVLNALDQVVQTTSPAVTTPAGDIRYQTDSFYDANDNLVRIDVQNVDENGETPPSGNSHFTTIHDYEILNHRSGTAQEVGDVNLATDVLQIADIPPEDRAKFTVTEYEYDANRNRSLIRYGEATNGNQPTNVLRTLYDERDLRFQEIRAEGDANQSTTQYDYDGNGNLTKASTGIEDTETPRVTTHEYDAYDRLHSSSDPMGNKTSLHYDPNGNLTAKLVAGELLDIAGQQNNVRLYEVNYVTYDAMDRLRRQEVEFFDTDTQDPIGDGKSVTLMDYSDNSQVTAATDDNGHVTLTSYDTANRTGVVTDAKGNTTTYTYDANSNVTAVTTVEKSDLGAPDEVYVTLSMFDALNRMTQTSDSVANITKFFYDSRSNRTRLLDALENVTTYEYDGINRILHTHRQLTDTGAGGGTVIGTVTTSQAWDDSSRLVVRKDPNLNVTDYWYDALNRLETTIYADGTTHLTTYDVHDNPETVLDPNGSTIESEFDLLDRVRVKNITPGPGVSHDTTSEIFDYDGLSHLVGAGVLGGLVNRSYDSLSHVVREILNGETTISEYDGVGNQTECTYPGGRVITTTYDELDRRRAISDGAGAIASYDYVGPDRLERREYGNGTRSVFEYDGILNDPDDFGVKQIVRTTHSVVTPASVIDDRTYNWDPLYNKIQRKDERGGGPQLTHDYEYDSIYRLRKTVVKDAWDVTVRQTDYTLDGAGNRTNVVGTPDPGPYFLDPTFPKWDAPMNQYTTTPFDARTYDENGNLLEAGSDGHSLSYDYKNRLVQFTDGSSGKRHTYAYDALGRRIKRVLDADGTPDTTRYFYDGDQVIEEQNAAGETEATYVYGRYIDEVLNMQRAGTDYYYHADDLYNVMAVTDGTKAVVERYEYQDYGDPEFFDGSGTPIAESSIGNPYLFTGRRYDGETELYYYRARYLDPRAGRFISKNPKGMWRDAANLGNTFTYVGSNPVTYADPLGQDIWDTLITPVDYRNIVPLTVELVREGTPEIVDFLGEDFRRTVGASPQQFVETVKEVAKRDLDPSVYEVLKRLGQNLKGKTQREQFGKEIQAIEKKYKETFEKNAGFTIWGTEIHKGKYCFEWAELVYDALQELDLKIIKFDKVSRIESTGRHRHSFVRLSLTPAKWEGDPRKQYVDEVLLDPYIGEAPKAYYFGRGSLRRKWYHDWNHIWGAGGSAAGNVEGHFGRGLGFVNGKWKWQGNWKRGLWETKEDD